MLDPVEHKKKTSRNRTYCRGKLTDRGIPFTAHNKNAHLVVTGSMEIIDYWPGTGLFKGRQTGVKGRGISNLIKLC